MKLITFQTKQALSTLKKTGILTTDASYIDMKKASVPYHWIVAEMKKRKVLPKNNEQYPIWAWAKCGSSIAPKRTKNYEKKKQTRIVKITFEKPDKEVFLSDYMAYSFILSGHIVPKSKTEYQRFLQQNAANLDVLKGFVRQEQNKKIANMFPAIQKTWARIFNLKSNIHQACVWNIKMSEVLKIEIINDPKHRYGTMNAKRADGSRPDWKKKYLKFL